MDILINSLTVGWRSFFRIGNLDTIRLPLMLLTSNGTNGFWIQNSELGITKNTGKQVYAGKTYKLNVILTKTNYTILLDSQLVYSIGITHNYSFNHSIFITEER